MNGPITMHGGPFSHSSTTLAAFIAENLHFHTSLVIYYGLGSKSDMDVKQIQLQTQGERIQPHMPSICMALSFIIRVIFIVRFDNLKFIL